MPLDDLLFAPRHRRQGDRPAVDLVLVLEEARDELRQVPIARGRQAAEPLEQLERDLPLVVEDVVGSQDFLLLVRPDHARLLDVLSHDRVEVVAVPGRPGDPGEVVYADDIGLDLGAVRLGHAQVLLDQLGQQVLRAEDLVAAAHHLQARHRPWSAIACRRSSGWCS